MYLVTTESWDAVLILKHASSLCICILYAVQVSFMDSTNDEVSYSSLKLEFISVSYYVSDAEIQVCVYLYSVCSILYGFY